MKNFNKCLLISFLLFCTAAASAQSQVKHIIILLQENRSFDSHFGQLGAYRAAHGYGKASDIDGLPANAANTNDEGTVIPSFHLATSCIEGISPDWLESHGDYNLNKPGSSVFAGDGFVHNAEGLAKWANFSDVTGRRAMGYYDGNDLPYYYFMASNFATSDRWFSPLSSNSNPNRIFIYAATSRGHVHDPGSFNSNTTPNIFQLLDKAGITWKIYYQQNDDLGNPLTDLSRFQPFASQHTANVVPDSQYFADLRNGTLPEVAYIEEQFGLDEHPGGTIAGDSHSGNDVQYGAQFAAQHINAFMQSSAWSSGVFFLTYDEAGGLYDHVAPRAAVHPDGIKPVDLQPDDSAYIVPQGDFNRTGFRVPLIVVSPFTKKSYVSHTVADYTAILKFVETRFRLPNLTNRDRAQMNMSEFFNFTNPPWMVPPQPPSQPLTMGCNNTDLMAHGPAQAVLSPSSLTFGAQTVKTSSGGQAVTLTNTGGTALALNGFFTSGDFFQTNNCGTSLSAGNSCTITVTFTPSQTGARTGTVTVNDSAAGSPHKVTLSGTGTAASTCTPPPGPGVVVCTPVDGSTVASPVNFTAAATPALGEVISAMWVYVDDVLVYQGSNTNTLNINVSIASGAHNIRTQVWDSSGALYQAGANITVSP